MPSKLPATRKAQTLTPAQGALPDLGAVEADHFEGWSLEDVRNWLIDVAPTFARAEMLTEHYRRACGLALYRVLAEEGEKSAAEFTTAVAEHAGVSARTVGNWRRAAMDAFSLPPPSKRSAAHLPTPTSHERAKTPPPLTAESTDKTPLPPLPETAYPAGAERLPVDEVDPAELVEHAQDERFTKSDPPPVPPAPERPKPANPCQRCGGTGEEPKRAANERRRPTKNPKDCRHSGAMIAGHCMDCDTKVSR